MSSSSKKGKKIPAERYYRRDPISTYRALTGTYPSNAQMWWSYKRPLELGTEERPQNYIEVFDPKLRHQVSTGNSPAPKGHYILPAFHRDRSRVSNIPDLPVQSAGKFRPVTCAFMSGRVFYAGVHTTNFNTEIYFTQIIERPDQIQHCFQSQDPTAEDIRDLLPSDGGVIRIPEVIEIHHLFVVGQALFVGASNGVWMITGSDGVGFKANDYTVAKVSGVPVVSSMSFVNVEGSPLWWNRSGIYTITQEQGTGPQVTSLTEKTIQSYFEDIPVENLFYAKGSYDPLKKRVQWLFRSTPANSETELVKYDKILNFDTVTGAFYIHTPAVSPRVDLHGIFNVEGFAVEEEVHTVLVDTDEVFVNNDLVTASKEYRRPTSSVTKYIVNILDEETSALPTPPDADKPTEPVLVYADEVFVNAEPVLWSPIP